MDCAGCVSVKVRQDLVLDVSKSGPARLAKQDLIKVEIKPRRIVFNKSSLETMLSDKE
jgi:hypothetical protein